MCAGVLCWSSEEEACCCSGSQAHLPSVKQNKTKQNKTKQNKTNKKPIEHRGTGLGVSGSSLYCEYCVSLKSMSVDGRGEKWCHLALSAPERGVQAHCYSGSLHRRANNQSPFVCLRLPSDPCLHLVCVPAVCPPGGAMLLCFISGELDGFQDSKF